jgi:excisionase family DNA binding protein
MIVAVVAKWADAHRIVEALTGEPPNDGDVHDPDKLPGVTIASGGPVGIPPRTPPAEPGPGTRLVYSAKEAAKALNLSESKTRELCYRKKLKSIKEGRRLLIPEWALREYVSGGSTYVEDLETQIDNRTI